MRLVEAFVEPRSADEAQALSVALDSLAAGDPHFGYRDYGSLYSAEARDLFTLDDKLARLRHEFGLTHGFSGPSVIFRETITRPVEVDFTFKRQMGGHGAFARVKLVFEPASPGAGLIFRSDIVGGAVPDAFIPGVVSGLNFAMEGHRGDGFSVMDVHVILVDGAFHDADSSPGTFDMAARGALAEFCKVAEFKTWEPVMTVSVAASGGDIVAVRRDLIERGGVVSGETPRGDIVFVAGEAPLAGLLDYVDRLHILSEGRARLRRMDFSRFAEAPQPDGPDGVFPPAVGMRLVGHPGVTASSV